MNRKETTALLSKSLLYHINPKNDPRIYWAREVSFDNATTHRIRVDFMKFVPVNNSVSGIEKGDVYCYEVKSSVEDFHSPNGHNFLGDYNYYVMPEEVFEQVKKEIPYHVGVFCSGWDVLSKRRILVEIGKESKKKKSGKASFRSIINDVSFCSTRSSLI